MADYRERIAALRRLGAEGSGATDAERKLANAKADELEAKYPESVSSQFTDDTTVTARDGFNWFQFRDPPTYVKAKPPPGGWDAYMQNLLRNQHLWNRPPQPDEADLVEEGFQYEPPDEDYGYDIFEGEEYQ